MQTCEEKTSYLYVDEANDGLVLPPTNLEQQIKSSRSGALELSASTNDVEAPFPHIGRQEQYRLEYYDHDVLNSMEHLFVEQEAGRAPQVGDDNGNRNIRSTSQRLHDDEERDEFKAQQQAGAAGEDIDANAALAEDAGHGDAKWPEQHGCEQDEEAIAAWHDQLEQDDNLLFEEQGAATAKASMGLEHEESMQQEQDVEAVAAWHGELDREETLWYEQQGAALAKWRQEKAKWRFTDWAAVIGDGRGNKVAQHSRGSMPKSAWMRTHRAFGMPGAFRVVLQVARKALTNCACTHPVVQD